MKPKLRAFLVLLMIICFSLYTTSANASQSEVDRLKEESENASQAVDDISNQKQAAEESKDALESQADSLEDEIDSLNSQITSVSDQISDTRESIELAEADIETLNAQLTETQETLDAQKEAMKLRIQYMYENKSTNILVNMLESGSISEFLQRLDYMSAIAEYDQNAIAEYEETQAQLLETQTALADKQDELNGYQSSLQSQMSTLGTLVSDTSTALNTTNTQIADTEAAIAILEEQLAEAEAYEEQIQAQYEAAQVALAQSLAGESGGYTGGYSTTDEETLLLAALIQAEAANQGDAGRLAVGSVVMNRVASSSFPNTVSGVIYASGQFAPVTSGRVDLILAEGPNSACQYAAAQAIAGNTNTDALFFCTYSYAQSLHESQVAAGQEGFLDRTTGVVINAHYFYNYK